MAIRHLPDRRRPRPPRAGPFPAVLPARRSRAVPTTPAVRRAWATVGLLAALSAVTACGSDSGGVAPTTATTGTAGAASATVPATASPAAASAKPSGTSTAGSRVVDKLPAKRGADGKVTVGDVSLVARTKVASLHVYSAATGATTAWTLKNPLPSGAPLVFLVLERRGDRLRVLVPVRPNGSQGWVRASDVTLFQHDYRMVVSVGKHTLTLYKAGKVSLQFPVGLGTGSTPTPGGVFYTKELLRPPDPKGAYGPYAYGLSGYSAVLENFGGGDGEIGIHGTNDPGSVGKNVSHGCIRMTNANITKLAGMLPLGVPVQIVS